MPIVECTAPVDLVVLSPDEAAELLDGEAHEVLGISGEEFRERWSAGEYATTTDPRITDLAILLPGDAG